MRKQYYNIVVILSTLILISNSLTAQNVTYLRTLGFGFSGGLSFDKSNSFFNSNNIILNSDITYLLLQNNQLTSFGFKARVQYGNLNFSDITQVFPENSLNYINNIDYLRFSGGINFQIHYGYDVSSLSFDLLFGNHMTNIDQPKTIFNSSSRVNEIIFCPSIKLKTWLTRGTSIDIGFGVTVPLEKKILVNSIFDLQVGFSFYLVNNYDEDEDGIEDDMDECRNTPIGELVNEKGCSLSQIDSDGDGVYDDKDLCPDTPFGELVYINGCAPFEFDSDGDGVYDDKDLCSDTPKGELVNINGCAPSQIDSDKDGILDSKDLCPNTPLAEVVDSNGCSSSQLDHDQDGIVDLYDRCPDEYEVYNFYRDVDGCPDQPDYRYIYSISSNVKIFKKNSSKISQEAKSIIEVDIIYLLTDYPKTYWIIKVESTELAKERAQSLKKLIDGYSNNPERTRINYKISASEKYLLILDQERAFKIVNDMFNIRN